MVTIGIIKRIKKVQNKPHWPRVGISVDSETPGRIIGSSSTDVTTSSGSSKGKKKENGMEVGSQIPLFTITIYSN